MPNLKLKMGEEKNNENTGQDIISVLFSKAGRYTLAVVIVSFAAGSLYTSTWSKIDKMEDNIMLHESRITNAETSINSRVGAIEDSIRRHSEKLETLKFKLYEKNHEKNSRIRKGPVHESGS